jgi:predicted GNAT family acetyltransferase
MWHSLEGPHRHVAQGDERARRYPVDIGPFAALPDEPQPEHFEALRDLVGPEGTAVLFRAEVTAPNDWELLGSIDGVQMVWPSESLLEFDARIITLGHDDVADMMGLAEETKPGPFGPRTVELGTYLGIRLDWQLAAMAGQRARTSEHVEISAVCTRAMHAGQGLGRALMNAQIRLILEEERIPMLHASASNLRAIALYEHLGFRHRRSVNGVIIRSTM